MSFLKGLLSTVVTAAVVGAPMIAFWQFRPAGQVNIDLSPSDYAFAVSTIDGSLKGADFTKESLASAAVSGQTIFIKKYWQAVQPGWGPGTREALPNARLFIVPGVRQTANVVIELDTLDVVNVKIPFKVTVEVKSLDDAANFVTSVYGSLSDAEQEKTEVRPDIIKFISQDAGFSQIKAATQQVYGQVALSKLDGARSSLIAAAKVAVTEALAKNGLTVTEFAYDDSDYVFNDIVKKALAERRDSLTELEAATKEVETAKQQANAVKERQKAFQGKPRLALKNRCIEIAIRYQDEVVGTAIKKGLYRGVKSAPSDYPLGVPTLDRTIADFNCEQIAPSQ